MGCANSRDGDKKINVLLLGLEQSGKSTFLYSLDEIEDLEPYLPTQGFQVYEIQKGQAKLEFHETGGHEELRDQWLDNLVYSDAIFYFIDANDKEKLPVALQELKRIAGDGKTQPYPLFVFCNKIDKANGAQESVRKQVDDVLAARKSHHKVFAVSCMKSETLNGAVNDVVNYFYPSCALMQPKRLSKKNE